MLIRNIILFLLTANLVFAAGNTRTLKLNAGAKNSEILALTYLNSYADTLKIEREAAVSNYALNLNYNDTVSVTNIILRRVINGVMIGDSALAGDTLSTAFSRTSGLSKSFAFTLQPLPEFYWFIINYAGSGNGTTGTIVRYSVARQYAK